MAKKNVEILQPREISEMQLRRVLEFVKRGGVFFKDKTLIAKLEELEDKRENQPKTKCDIVADLHPGDQDGFLKEWLGMNGIGNREKGTDVETRRPKLTRKLRRTVESSMSKKKLGELAGVAGMNKKNKPGLLKKRYEEISRDRVCQNPWGDIPESNR
jgi:hypothetical protein